MRERITLITLSQVREILPFVSVSGIYRGSKGTDVLTKFPHGLYSMEECLALKDQIIKKGLADRDKAKKRLKVSRPVRRAVTRVLV